MRIAFTGHRDKTAPDNLFTDLALEFPGATWVHGGAIGFDSQVEAAAKQHRIITEVIRPDYKSHGRGAPLVRNKTIVDSCELLVACFDGRTTGGTVFTINYARRRLLPVRLINPR